MALNEEPDNKGQHQAAREDVSIVMAVYNHENTVAQAIESALMQKMPYRSVIYCLNDASTDGSAAILERYAKRYPEQIRIFTSTANQGSGKKSFYHNKPPVRGRYWCLLAGDDYWTREDKLARQIEFLDGNPGYVGCSCNTVMRNEVTGEESIIKPDLDSWNLFDLLSGRHALYVHTASIIWRNIFLDKGFFLPPSYKNDYAFGDVVLMHMMLNSGGRMKNIPEEMSCYRVTGSGVWTSKSVKEQHAINRRVFKGVYKSIAWKYWVFANFHKLRRGLIRAMRTLIQGPANE